MEPVTCACGLYLLLVHLLCTAEPPENCPDGAGRGPARSCPSLPSSSCTGATCHPHLICPVRAPPCPTPTPRPPHYPPSKTHTFFALQERALKMALMLLGEAIVVVVTFTSWQIGGAAQICGKKGGKGQPQMYHLSESI